MSFSAKLTFLPGLLPFTLSNLDIIPSTFSIILLLLKVCLKFILIIYVCFFQSFLQNGFFVCKLNFFGKFCLFLCNLIIALYLIVILFFIFLLDYLRIQILDIILWFVLSSIFKIYLQFFKFRILLVFLQQSCWFIELTTL